MDGDVKGVDSLATFIFELFFSGSWGILSISINLLGPVCKGTLKVKGKFYSRTHIQIINTYSVLKRERNITRNIL